ncbi:helicase C-terminal domain-containing protein [Infundibulicybe gibba]|nr:helicase C-terminal domain-containing protein [Infundibulicybe gibba]
MGNLSLELELPTPDAFPAFPYSPPYAIQVDLMRHLYASIENRRVTIVESPTGTGKTLSLLCAGMTWLRDEKARARVGRLGVLTTMDDGAKDWVVEQTRERLKREMEAEEQEREARLEEARRREERARKMSSARVWKKPRRDEPPPSGNDNDGDADDAFLPETEDGNKEGEIHISPALQELMARMEKGTRSAWQDGDIEPTCTKIYYASRTHSQLAQVLPELERLKLVPASTAPSRPEAGARKRTMGEAFESEVKYYTSRTVSLGSRKQLCINKTLRARKGDLDEACRELLGEKGEKRCQYLPPADEETKMLDFRDQILASPKDIEDLAAAGRLAHVCPYFGSRRAIPQAELVTLPYNLLLQKNAREALGIDLKDQIVIIDEAHNLIPTLLSLSTTRLAYATLCTSFQQVCVYVARFRTRLGARNMLQLKRLVAFLDALKRVVGEWKAARTGNAEKVEMVNVLELMERLGRKAAGINLLEVEKYLRSSKIARKIAGYSDKEAEKNADPATQRRICKGAVPPLHAVEAFMLSLTGMNDDGRITLAMIGPPGQEDVELKYQLLNPAPHFQDVVDSARAVVLAGGTMSPISDVTSQLFAHLAPERVTSFSCGHIIPPENLQALVVRRGPRGGELEYKAGRQGDKDVIAELGQILVNFCNVVPGGMVVFFPSYAFLNGAKTVWAAAGVIEKMGVKKKVFFEPEESTYVEKVLQDYAAAIKGDSASTAPKTRGALLFAVIGAKLSEGLNFTDDLARCVIIVGLPFANLGSAELQERMKYVRRLAEGDAKRPRALAGRKDAGAELYENMCMNAVNQSIGRAIRHREDWASLILLDQRYATPAIRGKLPGWISGSVRVMDGFGQAVGEMGAYFRGKRG